jgi:serine/threonine-protein kinase
MSEVFEVVHDGVYAVVKKIKKLPGAERELLVADLGDCRNIVPFDEVVETDSEILIRMPKAERSLNQHLEAAGGPLRETEVIAVLTDLATALSDCGRIVVHRDIKPQNALLLGVHWCLSDFGIARYAEAATASQTRKGWRSPPWTAPERWEGKRATIKSDIYSLGVVAYQMATGQLPFQGPDFHEQHREQHPTPPSGVSPLLRALIAEMLAKSPDARPTPEQLLERLAAVAKPASSSAVARLQGLAAQRVEHIANDDADPARAVLEREQRDLLGQSGRSMLRDLVEPLGRAWPRYQV